MVSCLRHHRQGQAMVEMVFVLPVLLLLILGLVSVGQILMANYTVSQATRAAAHAAALEGGEPEAAYDTAETVLRGGVGTEPDRATVQVSCASSPCRRYDPVEVRITYTGELWAPFPGFASAFTVRAEATRAAERDAQ